MTTPEQQARDPLTDEETLRFARHYPIVYAAWTEACAQRDALKAELAAIKGAGEPVAWVKRSVLKPDAIHGDVEWLCSEGLGHGAPLYTRPCVPLTDEQIDELWRAPMSADWEHREFARAIEAYIKGAK